MPTIKEYREFFLRAIKTTSGSKPDQEANYPTTSSIGGSDKGNRFLKGHYPTEDIFKKFLESIVFKLNPEDTASVTVQGLTKKASDADAEARTANPTTDVSKSVAPHQLPEIVIATDGSDVAAAAVIGGGISVSTVKRTLGAIFRRNYLLSVAVRWSLEIEAVTQRLQLKNDLENPGSLMLYGTDGAGAKGWFAQPSIPVYEVAKGVYLQNNHIVAVNPGGEVIVGIGPQSLGIDFTAVGTYEFRAFLFVSSMDASIGLRVGLYSAGPLVAAAIDWYAEYIDTATGDVDYKSHVTALGTAVGKTAIGPGVYRITGTITVSTPGIMEIKAARNAPGVPNGTIKAGSYIVAQELFTNRTQATV